MLDPQLPPGAGSEPACARSKLGSVFSVGVIEHFDGFAGVAVRGLVEAAVEVDRAVAGDAPGDLHAQPGLELLRSRTHQRLVLQEAVERRLTVESAMRVWWYSASSQAQNTRLSCDRSVRISSVT